MVRTTFRGRRSLLAVAAVALVGLTACSAGSAAETGATEGGQAAAEPVKTLRLGFFPNLTHAPALATASVGIAMGAIGSDVAIENADIALMNDNLNMIPYLVGLGRKSVAKIRTNTVSAVAIKFLFLSLALGGVSNLGLAIFADVGVTILVILNSLRLYGYRET